MCFASKGGTLILFETTAFGSGELFEALLDPLLKSKGCSPAPLFLSTVSTVAGAAEAVWKWRATFTYLQQITMFKTFRIYETSGVVPTSFGANRAGRRRATEALQKGLRVDCRPSAPSWLILRPLTSCWAADRAVGRTIWAAALVTNVIYSQLRLHYGHHCLKNQSPMGGDSKQPKIYLLVKTIHIIIINMIYYYKNYYLGLIVQSSSHLILKCNKWQFYL